jgi:Peptidase family S41
MAVSVRPATDAVEQQLESGSLDSSALGEETTLREFIAEAGELSTDERARLVDQARVLIEDLYVHLPLKRAMHAVDPVQRLKLLRYRLERMSERRFHDELIRIFTGLRDLHTNYILPAPYQSKTAFLPFLIEEYFEDGESRFIVSKTFPGFEHPTFKAGVTLRYWNGVPIERAVDLNADRQAGSNLDARRARGVEAMTIRPMAQSAPPDEEWVVVGYADDDGQDQALLLEWRVFEPDPSPEGVDPNAVDKPAARSLGIDAKTEAVRRAKKLLFAPKAMAAEEKVASARAQGGTEAVGASGVDVETTSTMPDVFSFGTVETSQGAWAYIRIWTFNVDDADAFVAEFVRIASLLPQEGLIVDVRGNGGGLITAGERLLQVLTPRAIEPERLAFVNTPLTFRLARENDFISQWTDSIAQAVETGSTFSLGFPIEPDEEYNRIGQQYQGPVVLITDALCYSTTDIFAAGFQDHRIGPILGTSGNTGAGGANVWTHDLLSQLITGPDSPFEELPSGASFRVSIRRTTRVGDRAGVPVEDLGVVPDEIHQLTKRDLLEGNQDLFERAGALLAGTRAYALTVDTEPEDAGLQVKATTRNLSRIDVSVNTRPVLTVDVADGENGFEVAAVGDGDTVELRGFDGERLAACRRIEL